MLVRNTLWARRFFRQAAKLFDNPHLVADVRPLASGILPQTGLLYIASLCFIQSL